VEDSVLEKDNALLVEVSTRIGEDNNSVAFVPIVVNLDLEDVLLMLKSSTPGQEGPDSELVRKELLLAVDDLVVLVLTE